MNKTLYPLLAAGIIGCSGYNDSYVVITQPVLPRANESEFFEHAFQDAEKRECHRFVYVGYNYKTERLQSVLRVEHCFTEGQGYFRWTRFEDTNDDGIVDRLCWQEKSNYAGLKQEDGKIRCEHACRDFPGHDCFEGYRLLYHLGDALSWAKPSLQQP